MCNARIKMPGVNELVEVNVNPETNTFAFDGIDYHTADIQLGIPVSGTIYGTLLNYRGAL